MTLLTIVTAFGTISLAVVTLFYLIETRSIRKIAEKSYLTDSAPKVYLEKIEFEPKLNESSKQIEIFATLRIKNGGSTEVENFIAYYSFAQANTNIQNTIGPVPFLFPNQGVQYNTKMFVLSLNQTNYDIAKNAKDTNKSLIIPKNITETLFLEIKLNFTDKEGKQHSIPYFIEYHFYNNSWGFIIKEDQIQDERKEGT